MAIAVLAAAGTASAFAQNAACPTCEGDPLEMAEEARLNAIPVSLWLDHMTYATGDIIKVTGHVANIAEGYPITIKIVSPAGNTILIDQIDVDSSGDFESEYVVGSWSQTGIYHVMAQYGTTARDNKAQFELVESATMPAVEGCGTSMLAVEELCVAYDIKGGTVDGASVNTDDNSIILHVSAVDDGSLHIDFPPNAIDEIFLVLVDGEESDDVMIDGQTVSVYFMAGTESIEFLGSSVIPEFGAVAALVLAVAIISIVAVSARSRLGIVPRF